MIGTNGTNDFTALFSKTILVKINSIFEFLFIGSFIDFKSPVASDVSKETYVYEK